MLINRAKRPCTPLFGVCLAAIFGISSGACAQQTTVPPHAAPSGAAPDAYSWQRVPIQLTAEQTDAHKAAMLSQRGEFFDQLIGAPTPLDVPSSMVRGMSAGGEVSEEFPTSKADAVVVAVFKSFAPHLSPSRRSVYTDVTMQCESVAFVRHGNLSANTSFDVLISGGTVVPLGSDRAISYGIERSPFGIVPGQRYLLFLRYHAEGAFYTVRKSWSIRNQVLLANSVVDSRRVSDNSSAHAGKRIDRAIDEIKALGSQ